MAIHTNKQTNTEWFGCEEVNFLDFYDEPDIH